MQLCPRWVPAVRLSWSRDEIVVLSLSGVVMIAAVSPAPWLQKQEKQRGWKEGSLEVRLIPGPACFSTVHCSQDGDFEITIKAERSIDFFFFLIYILHLNTFILNAFAYFLLCVLTAQ